MESTLYAGRLAGALNSTLVIGVRSGFRLAWRKISAANSNHVQSPLLTTWGVVTDSHRLVSAGQWVGTNGHAWLLASILVLLSGILVSFAINAVRAIPADPWLISAGGAGRYANAAMAKDHHQTIQRKSPCRPLRT